MSIRDAAGGCARGLLLGAALAAAAGLSPASASAADRGVVLIAAERAQAVDSATADAICRLVRRTHGGDCVVEATGGPDETLALLRDGGVPFGILPADIAGFAHRGEGDYAESGPFDGLRTAAVLYEEKLTVVAGHRSDIRDVEQLAGNRIAIAGPGQGRSDLWAVIKGIKDWNRASFAGLDRLGADEWNAALCAGRLDAVVAPIVHPDARVKATTTACPTTLVAVQGPEIDVVLADKPYWRRTEIPGNLYLGSPEPTPTVGISVILATSVDVPDAAVSRLVSAVLGNFDRFRKLHPFLGRLAPRDLVGDDEPGVPYHPGVERHRVARGAS